MSASEFIVVMSAIDNKTTAKRIIDALLSEQLAACIQIMPIQSHYVWEGEVRESKEQLLLIKTKSDHYPAIEHRINEIHDYEVPEILSIPVKDGFDPYLEWIKKVTK